MNEGVRLEAEARRHEEGHVVLRSDKEEIGHELLVGFRNLNFMGRLKFYSILKIDP